MTRDEIRALLDEFEARENLQRATRFMPPEAITRLWARTVREKGAGHPDADALSEALDWRHTDAQRLRDEAMQRPDEVC
jgi:hypothetical protein